MTEPAGQTNRPGSGAAKALATRATLVDLAADLFAEQGYLQRPSATSPVEGR